MSRKSTAYIPKGSTSWIPKRKLNRLNANYKRGMVKALELRVSASTLPLSVHKLANWWLGELLNDKITKQGNDHAYIAATHNIECQAFFLYHENLIVKVLRDKRGTPSPRIQFTLAGYDTKATIVRLNRYAVELGVKFYCWKYENQMWAIWVHDGTVLWSPIDKSDQIIATNV